MCSTPGKFDFFSKPLPHTSTNDSPHMVIDRQNLDMHNFLEFPTRQGKNQLDTQVVRSVRSKTFDRETLAAVRRSESCPQRVVAPHPEGAGRAATRPSLILQLLYHHESIFPTQSSFQSSLGRMIQTPNKVLFENMLCPALLLSTIAFSPASRGFD